MLLAVVRVAKVEVAVLEAAARRFLVELNRLLQSLSVWTTPNPSAAKLSEEQRHDIEVEFTQAGDNLKDVHIPLSDFR